MQPCRLPLNILQQERWFYSRETALLPNPICFSFSQLDAFGNDTLLTRLTSDMNRAKRVVHRASSIATFAVYRR